MHDGRKPHNGGLLRQPRAKADHRQHNHRQQDEKNARFNQTLQNRRTISTTMPISSNRRPDNTLTHDDGSEI